MLELIDTHAHLDEFDDLNKVVEDSRAAGVIAIIAVGVDYNSNNKNLDIAAEYTGFVFPALGLHPSQLGQMDDAGVQKTLYQIESNIHRIVAVGEIGLDYNKYILASAAKDRQQAVLKEVLGLAKKYQKPVIIHSRYSWKDALTMVTDAGIGKAVFHWFTGPSSVLREIIAAGYFISATPAAEYHSEHRRAVREAAASNFMLETDSPVEYGRDFRFAAQPKDVQKSLMAAAEIRSVGPEILADQTTKNAIRFFSLPIL
jgi:TatD DNase family protein